jgi:hypothetical protein
VRITKAEIEQAAGSSSPTDIMVGVADAIASSHELPAGPPPGGGRVRPQALRAEQKKLDNGKSTSFQVLQLQRILTTRAYENIRARVDYKASLARLAQSEGSTLDRHHVNLEFR